MNESPSDVTEHQTLVLEKLAGLEKLLRAIVTLLEQQAQKPPAPIATYEQMYGPIEAPALPVVADPRASQPQAERTGRLRRWFLRESD